MAQTNRQTRQTDKQTDGHGDSMAESAQRADSVREEKQFCSNVGLGSSSLQYDLN